jgi:two-component system sensor histidine kinase/response regulator
MDIVLSMKPPSAAGLDPASAPAAAETQAMEQRLIAHQLEMRHRGARILIVEDDVFGQEIIAEYVGAVGLAVELAGDGVEALQKAQRERFDLILMDIQMPRMDGLEATRYLRQLPSHTDIPIIAVTAHAYAIAEEMSMQAGMNAFLTKPLDPGTLYATLLVWLDRRRFAGGSA